MITIISLSEQTELLDWFKSQDYYIETDLLEIHLNLTETRSLDQLLERFENGLNNKIATKLFGKEYKDRLKFLNDVYGNKWVINDCRVLWFYDQWLKNDMEQKVIAIKNSNKGYTKLLKQWEDTGYLLIDENKIDYDEILAYVHN